MQCKDISEMPILEFLQANVYGLVSFDVDDMFGPHHVHNAMPKDVPPKLAWAKMNSLVKRGLVDGCTCGCNGNYQLTDKGLEYLESHRTCV